MKQLWSNGLSRLENGLLVLEIYVRLVLKVSLVSLVRTNHCTCSSTKDDVRLKQSS